MNRIFNSYEEADEVRNELGYDYYVSKIYKGRYKGKNVYQFAVFKKQIEHPYYYICYSGDDYTDYIKCRSLNSAKGAGVSTIDNEKEGIGHVMLYDEDFECLGKMVKIENKWLYFEL